MRLTKIAPNETVRSHCLALSSTPTSFADDVRVVSVRDVHLHGDPRRPSVQEVEDHGLGLLDGLLGRAADPDVRIYRNKII